MDKQEILKRAKEYVKNEKHKEFASDVEKLIEQNNESELFERFYTDLEFGTSGLRGVMAGGLNNMNPFVVSRATQGFSNYLLAHGNKDKEGKLTIAIAYDSRNNSELFAKVVAGVFAGNGIRTKLFSSLRPTPELSFVVMKLGLSGGLVLTASHNPPKYNGYKVYWSDGGSVIPPNDSGITKEVMSVKEIKTMDFDQAVSAGFVEYFGQDIDKMFVENTKEVLIRKDLFFEKRKSIKIVYTPLHGTGSVIFDKLKEDLDLNLIYVPEQKEPNGNFPTTSYPNPEEAQALKMAIDLAKKEKADLVIATDPDADRIGIAIPKDDNSGEWELINGNTHGVLMVDYLMSAKKETNTMPSNPFYVNTIVTTLLQNKIAKSYGVEDFRVLTGFKWIGAKVREELAKGKNFLMGDEESYGFLLSKNINDKDSFTAALLTMEMVLYYKSQGKSLLKKLAEIYEKFGYHQDRQLSKTFEGASGLQKIASLMDKVRKNPLKTVAGQKVVRVVDIQESYSLDLNTGKKENVDLPKSNVIQYFLEDTSMICLRPSGTEPKIKYYFCLVAKDANEMQGKMKKCFDEFEELSK